MKKIWYILVREYLENVRTKAFLLGIILTPLWFGMVFLVPLLAQATEMETQRVVIADNTGLIGADVKRTLEAKTGRSGKSLYEVELRLGEDVSAAGLGGTLRGQAAEGELIAVILTKGVLEKGASPDGEPPSEILHAATAGVFENAQVIQGVVNDAVNRHIMQARGIAAEDLTLLEKDALAITPLTRGGEEGGVAQFAAPMIFMMFLFMGIVGISQMLVNSTIEEKASRVYEVLLSSMSPFQLMAGKLLGICGVGFTLMLFWVGGSVAAASLQGMDGVVTGGQIGLFVAYYVLGFLMIASLMLAIGSACNTLKEAQNLMVPVSMLLALPLLLSLIVLRAPHGTFATVASFIPPFTPFLMMARAAAVPGPPTWQIVASLLLLVVSTWLTVRLAARIFRVGILMHGKPPTLREIFRWIRRA